VASEGGGWLPVQSASIEGSDVVLGWKAPALLLAPLWIVTRPTLLPLLLLAWLRLPNNGRGRLEWEGFVDSRSLNKGLWRFMLGRVLDVIGRASLPAMLATLNADGTSSGPARLSSECTGVSIGKGGKLVLDGRLQRFAVAQRPLSSTSPAVVVEEVGPLDYTLRMGLRPGSVESDGTVIDTAGLGGPAGAPLRSCLIYAQPELKLSLGSSPLLKLLPSLWVPVAMSSGVALPTSLALSTVSVSDAGDGVSARGFLSLDGRAGEGPATYGGLAVRGP